MHLYESYRIFKILSICFWLLTILKPFEPHGCFRLAYFCIYTGEIVSTSARIFGAFVKDRLTDNIRLQSITII
jgi:hypothetical protein